MIFDTHCHIYDQVYNDVNKVIENAKEKNVNYMLVLGDNYENSLKAVELAKQYSCVFAAIGIFPTECHGLDLETEIDKIRKMYQKSNKIKCIGEIGLDYYWEKDEVLKNEQKKFFIAQLKLADELNLPCSIHARDSIEDVYKILKEFMPKKKVILHCFSSSVEMMKRFVELGCYISLGGPVTFKNAVNPKKVAQEVPIDRLLIETDSPYLSPHPIRGQINEPKNVVYVLKEIATLRNMNVEELENIIFDNSLKVLGIEK